MLIYENFQYRIVTNERETLPFIVVLIAHNSDHNGMDFYSSRLVPMNSASDAVHTSSWARFRRGRRRRRHRRGSPVEKFPRTPPSGCRQVPHAGFQTRSCATPPVGNTA